MPLEQFFAKTPYNFDRLHIELSSVIGYVGLSTDNNGVRVSMADATSQATWDSVASIIAAHDASSLTDKQQIIAAREAIIAGHDYLQNALLQDSPNLTSIYNTLKTNVDANSYLSKMVNNQIDLMRTAYGWSILNLVSPTAIDRARYVQAVQVILALLNE